MRSREMVVKIKKVLQEKYLYFSPELVSHYLLEIIVGAIWSCHLLKRKIFQLESFPLFFHTMIKVIRISGG
jgi:hypothetical protein